METFSALLAVWTGNSPVTGEFPAQRPVTQRFDVFFDLRLDQYLSKQWRRWWFKTPLRSLWRHCNDDESNGTPGMNWLSHFYLNTNPATMRMQTLGQMLY